MENEMVSEMVDIVEVDTEKALEVGEQIIMSDYTRGFLHGGIALGAVLGAKKVWDNRQVIKLRAKALIGKADILEIEE